MTAPPRYLGAALDRSKSENLHVIPRKVLVNDILLKPSVVSATIPANADIVR